MRQLTQLEKRLLIILAIQKQMVETGTIGDFSKTINTTSNQIKQLQETLKEISRWIGQLMMYYLQPLVENILSVAVAFREMLKTLNLAKGYTLPDFMSGNKNNNQLEETTEDVDNLLESVENLKNALLGFDEINVLGSTGVNVESTELEKIYAGIGKYSSILGETENNANRISGSILKWLGYIRDVDTGAWKFNVTLETTGDKVAYVMSKLLELKNIASDFIFEKVENAINSLPDIISNMFVIIESIVSDQSNYSFIERIINNVVLPFVNVSSEAVKNIFESINKLVPALLSIVENVAQSIITNLPKVIDQLNLTMQSITQGLEDFIVTLVPELGKTIESIATMLKEKSGEIAKSISDFVKDTINNLSGLLQTLLSDETISNLVSIIENVLKAVTEALPDILLNLDIAGILATLLELITDNVPKIVKAIVSIIEVILKELANMISSGELAQALNSIIKSVKYVLFQFIPVIVEMIGEILVELGKLLNPKNTTIGVAPTGIFDILGDFSKINKISDILNDTFKLGNPISKLFSGNLFSNALTSSVINESSQLKKTNLVNQDDDSKGNQIANSLIKILGGKKADFLGTSILPIVQAITDGNNKVAQAVENKNTSLYINGRQFAEATSEDYEETSERKNIHPMKIKRK